jgi:hypothetical protein
MQFRAALLIVAALVLPLATACAGDGDVDRDDYEETVVETRNRVDTAFGSISEAQSRKDFTQRMQEAAVVIGRAADDLGKNDAPEEFEDETDELEAALHQLSGDLEGTAAQLRQTPELFETAGLSFEGWTNANKVLRTLNQQGISVRPLARH